MNYNSSYDQRYQRDRQDNHPDYTSDTFDWPSAPRSSQDSTFPQGPLRQYEKKSSSYSERKDRGSNRESKKNAPQPPSKQYAPEWYAPHRNKSSESRPASHHQDNYSTNQQEYYNDQDQYPTGTAARPQESEKPEWDGALPVVPQLPHSASSLGDSVIHAAQEGLAMINARKARNKMLDKKLKGKRQARKLARQERWKNGTPNKEDIAVKEYNEMMFNRSQIKKEQKAKNAARKALSAN